MIKEINGGITAAKGYKATGIHVGIKKKKKDLALIVSEKQAVIAGTFTLNKVKAASVIWNQQLIKIMKTGQAIVINSGVANACTGAEGKKNNERMAEYTAKQLNIEKESVYVASTGVIGKQLPIDIIEFGIKNSISQLGYTDKHANNAAEAIMTTDTYKKEIAISINIGDKTIYIGGMAKGSGMIHPNMATMLSFITTDLAISKELLQEALNDSVQNSYNMISVDGDTSTNDMVLIMANGCANNTFITEKNEEYNQFVEALNYVNIHLAKLIAADGEGATKLLETTVNGCKSLIEARQIAKTVISSNLVKTAIFGEDANWGRIICAMGYSMVEFDPDLVNIELKSEKGTIEIVKNGVGTDYDETKASNILRDCHVKILINMNDGNYSATAWGCDLSYDYVKINADYRT